MPHTIAVVAEGNAETPDCWSGSAERFVAALRRQGARVDVFDVAPRSWRRALAAGLTVHPDRRRWRQRFELGAVPFALKSAQATTLVGRAIRSGTRYDAIVQIGATFMVDRRARAGAAYVLYADSNVRYALRGAPYSGAARLSAAQAAGVARREQRVYDSVDRLWAMSEALGRSFAADFAQPPAKVTALYAGANQLPPAPPADRERDPVILFIGKDHERKGSAVLLEAFAAVRAAVPEAELHIVGAVPPGADRPGVTAHGFVSRRTPEGASKLDALFARASVFCLPSHYEPFGIVFVEAMLAGLPCVGTTEWAMPEIIREGETGWLVPPGEAAPLAATLVAALTDRSGAAAMGARGRERALTNFTWDRVAARALGDLEAFAATGAASGPRARVT